MGLLKRADSWLRKQNPWVGVTLSLISVTLGIIGIFLFFQGQQKGQIASAHSIVQIYDQEASYDAISVVTRDGKKIEDKIFAVETVIANTGDISLTKDRKRKPLVLYFGLGTEIIDARISASTDKKVTAFSFVKERESKDALFRELIWDHFDPGHSVRITSIVSSKKDVVVLLLGQYLGIEFVRGTLEKPEDAQRRNRDLLVLLKVVAGLAFLISCVLITAKLLQKASLKITAYEIFDNLMSLFVAGFALVAIGGMFIAILYWIFFSVSVPYIQ